MIRRLGVRVALLGVLVMTAAGVPVEIGMIDRAEERARSQELETMREGARLAASTLGKVLRTPATVATLTELCASVRAHLELRDPTGTPELASCDPPSPRGPKADSTPAPETKPRVPQGVLTALRDLSLGAVGEREGWVFAKVAASDRATLTVARRAALMAEARREGRRTALLLLALGLGLVATMSLLVSYLASNAVSALVAGVRDVVRGNARRLTVPGVPGDAIVDLSTWLNVLAEDVERKSAALTVEQGKLVAVLEGMTQGVVGLEGGRIELMNQAARKMLGLSAPLVGERLSDYVDVPELTELLEQGKPGTSELVLPTKLRALAHLTAKPNGHGLVLVLEDVSAIRHLETVRRDFVANVSHELRTPVAVIRANAETLLAGAKDDPHMAGRLIDGLHRNAERLARLIADLLDLSRLDAGQYRLDLGTVSLAAAAEHALTAIGDRGHPVSLQVATTLAVRADRKALDQVLVNLLENAVRYTPEGTEISIAAFPEGEQVRLEVRDRGPGIPAAHRDRVFERFYRADPGRSRDSGGTGLGLAIVKHLVESMGGQVRLLPNEPSGCNFVLHLPRASSPA